MLWPIANTSVTVQVCVLALPMAIIAILVFKYTSNQDRIHREKDLIKAHLLELRLYKDDFVVTLGSQGQILRHTFIYMRQALLPMAVMMLPFILMMINVESRFAFRSVNVDEPITLSVIVNADKPVINLPITLELPDVIVTETPALRINSNNEILWRLRAVSAGAHLIKIQTGTHTIERTLYVGGDTTILSPVLYTTDDPKSLLYPAEPALAPDLGIDAISFDYPRARSEFGGISSASWLLMGVSLVFGFLLRGTFGVTF